MADENQSTMETLNALRKSFESKQKDTAEEMQKQADLIKEIGDKEEVMQKTFNEKIAEGKKLEATIEEMKVKMDAVYKSGSRQAFGSDAEHDIYRKYASELDGFIRSGKIPDSEIMDELVHDLARKSLTTNDEDKIADLAKQLKSEGGKGQLIFLRNRKDYLTAINPNGGYWTSTDTRTDIQVNQDFETSPIRSIARVITTSSGDIDVIIRDEQGISGGWVGETQTRPATATPTIGQLNIATHEHFAQPEVTQKMIDDSIVNIEQIMIEEINDIFIQEENTAFVTGDGSKKPKGFLSYDDRASADVYERDTLEQLDSGINGAFTADNFIELQNRLKGVYQAPAVWGMKRLTWGEVLKLKDGQGRYQLNFEMMADGAGLRLLGKRVVWMDDMPVRATNSLSVVYGDFSKGYTVVDRVGVRLIRDELTNKPFIKFYATKRVGGAVTNYEAIKILRLAA